MADLNALIDPYVTNEVVTVSAESTVGQTLTQLRDRAIQPRIFYLYAVDSEKRLQGVVPVRTLLAADPERPLREILVAQVQSLRLGMKVAEALDFFLTHRFLALPVVDARGRLTGAVFAEQFADTVIEIAEGRVSSDIFESLGIHADEARMGSVPKAVRQRFPWLLVNVAGGVGCAAITGLFARTIQEIVIVALFIPIVLVLAESVGIQATAISVRRFHTLPFARLAAQQLLNRELKVAVCLGLLAGVLVGLVSHLFGGSFRFGVAVAVAIVGSVSVAAGIGTLLPVAFRAWRIDPAVAVGPLVLALADNATILIYLALVRLVAAH